MTHSIKAVISSDQLRLLAEALSTIYQDPFVDPAMVIKGTKSYSRANALRSNCNFGRILDYTALICPKRKSLRHH
jgi:hypothetical protein